MKGALLLSQQRSNKLTNPVSRAVLTPKRTGHLVIYFNNLSKEVIKHLLITREADQLRSKVNINVGGFLDISYLKS